MPRNPLHSLPENLLNTWPVLRVFIGLVLGTKIKDRRTPTNLGNSESWTVKKAEHRRIDAFELWCWRRLLRVPWTARRSNRSILEEISPGCSLEGMMLKLKLQYFGHLLWRVDSLEKTLMLVGTGAGGEGDDRGWDGWMASLTRWCEFEWTSGVGDGQGGLACCDSWGLKELDTPLGLNWTELKWLPKCRC